MQEAGGTEAGEVLIVTVFWGKQLEKWMEQLPAWLEQLPVWLKQLLITLSGF